MSDQYQALQRGSQLGAGAWPQGGATIAPYNPTAREVYGAQLKDAQANVERLTKILDLLDRNPDYAELLQLTGRY